MCRLLIVCNKRNKIQTPEQAIKNPLSYSMWDLNTCYTVVSYLATQLAEYKCRQIQPSIYNTLSDIFLHFMWCMHAQYMHYTL